MSKIIKRTKITDPAILEPYIPPVLEGDPVKGAVRSLEFAKTVRNEIDTWSRKFAENRAAWKKHRDLQTEKAYKDGYDRGFSDGLNRERSERMTAIDALLREAKRKQEHAVRDIETKVVELAVRMAERIIGRALETAPEMVMDIVRETLSAVIGGETVVLKVSEEDLALVNTRYEQWLGMSGNAREFRIESDKRLRRGDCVVETEGGIIDAVVSSRLDYLTEELLKH